MKFIYFKNGRTAKTGRLLRKYLNLYSQRSLERGVIRPTTIAHKLIRWGNSDNYGQTVGEELNSVEAIENASNKLRALTKLKEANISIPWFSTDKEEVYEHIRNSKPDIRCKVVGRPSSHQGGSNFNVLSDYQNLSIDYISSHWLELIDIHKEWRVHVFQGEVIGVSRKTDEGVEWRITNRYTRNHTNGWRFIKCDLYLVQDRLKELAVEAVNTLGLDFGAVDIILSEGTESTSRGSKKYYVLEVNSAPSIEEGSTVFYNYIERFKEWLIR